MHLLSRYGQVCSLHEVDAVEVDAADCGGAAALGFAEVSTEAGGVSFFAATAGLAATVGVAAVTAAAAFAAGAAPIVRGTSTVRAAWTRAASGSLRCVIAIAVIPPIIAPNTVAKSPIRMMRRVCDAGQR